MPQFRVDISKNRSAFRSFISYNFFYSKRKSNYILERGTWNGQFYALGDDEIAVHLPEDARCDFRVPTPMKY